MLFDIFCCVFRKSLSLLIAESPIDVTVSGIVILVSPLQPLNAESPIDVTVSGIVILVSPLQPQNTEEPIDVTLLGITRSVLSSLFKYKLCA